MCTAICYVSVQKNTTNIKRKLRKLSVNASLVPGHEHIGIKQMQLIRKRSSLTDMTITAKDLLNILFKPQILFISFVCRTEKMSLTLNPSVHTDVVCDF